MTEGSRTGTIHGPDTVATATAWAAVRERDVAELLTPSDVRNARILGTMAPALAVPAAVLAHFAFASPGPTTVNHQTVVMFLGMSLAIALAAPVVLLIGHRGLGSNLPPPPAGPVDREALGPFFQRDVRYRVRRGSGVAAPALMGVCSHVVFLQGHMPTTAPPNLVALGLVAFAAVYVVLDDPDRDRLARDIAGDIAGLVEEATG